MTSRRTPASDPDAFRALTDPYRRELQLHCYRMLGSAQDAEDLVQETLLAAWRGIDAFEGRSSLRAWLYRIATNRCINALRDRGRRPAVVPAPAGPPAPSRTATPEATWLEPYPDALLDGIPDDAPGPDAIYELKESVALAFVAALQELPPRQRAILVLRDVLGFRAAEVADVLGTTEHAVAAGLRRARAAVPGRGRHPEPLQRRRWPAEAERRTVDRFADAFARADVDAIVRLLAEDAVMTMPPEPLVYEGREAIAGFLRWALGGEARARRVVPAPGVNGHLALHYFRDGEDRPYGLLVLDASGDRIGRITRFRAG